jgi:hypothetical protein
MEFKKIKREQGLVHEVTFTADESKIISAIYTEAINYRIKHGNTSSISDHDTCLARAYNKPSGIKGIFGALENLHNTIHEFVERTDSEARELTGVDSAFRNHDAIERIEYGKAAEKMLGELQEHLQAERQHLPPLPDTWEVPDRPPKDLL